MEQVFSEFYGPDDDYLDELWGDAVVTFDASSLLNLYELSPTARDEILTFMDVLKSQGRLWLSHQAGLEFHRNRTVVAVRIANRLNALRSTLTNTRRAFEKDARHLDATEAVLAALDRADTELKAALGERLPSGAKHPTVDNDTLLHRLNAVFDSAGMVGKAYPKKRLKRIYKAGRRRYAALIPPGFEDDEKLEPARFGDLIVWMQLQDAARSRGVSLLLVTDDAKDDWTIDQTGRGMRVTHPMLRDEFERETGRAFWSYATEAFLKEARQRLAADVSDDTIEEVREVATTHRRSEAQGESTGNWALARLLPELTSPYHTSGWAMAGLPPELLEQPQLLKIPRELLDPFYTIRHHLEASQFPFGALGTNGLHTDEDDAPADPDPDDGD